MEYEPYFLKADRQLKRLRAEVKRLRAQVARLKAEVTKWLQKAAEFEDEVRRLKMCEGMARTATEERDAALEKFGVHPPSCPYYELTKHGVPSAIDPCSCGLLAALSPDAGKGWLPGGLDREAIREGVKAMKEGRVTPWEDVERELGLEDYEHDDRHECILCGKLLDHQKDNKTSVHQGAEMLGWRCWPPCQAVSRKGWLSPEVRKQVLADIVRVLDAHAGYYSDEFRSELCAALDALEVK